MSINRKASKPAHKRTTKTGQIRIIGGQHRGRKLPVHDIEGLRPTTDRVKETVFNWLMMDIRDAQVLDCFAGAGSLGFEAQSRFAKQVTLFELEPKAAQQLHDNAALLNMLNVSVQQGDALSLLAQPSSAAYDIAFIDPPFNKGLAYKCAQALEENGWLADDALVYVEVEANNADFTAPDNWQLQKEKRAGQAWGRLYQRM